ncbi:hypothetical protein SAMN05216516_11299 [Izhakiella capsodis]|uniref:Uncharacterized protein n=1 Tax=Izhakiella capsodis TaxID=1367852 RepID=A0A1I5AP58_9GAMM|nr:hypothetical protein [Izhakiella capsodis]SFN64150.1 hypothetical protein SAMN05216516_11299 [Izhakiella capsodis]
MSNNKSDQQYQNEKHPARDRPKEHGEVPRGRDSSQDYKKDPYKKSGK